MPTSWLRYCSALALSLFFPWFPAVASSPPENQSPAVAAGAGTTGEPQPVASAAEEPVVLPGVVIEEIPKGSALEKAGLQVGDVILSWERLPNPPANPEGAQGELTSYFDWLELEVEQVPRGAVVLRGRRGREPLEFKVQPGNWEAKVRPVLAREFEEIYLAGSAQLASGDIEDAVRALSSLADSPGDQGGSDLRAWVALWVGIAREEKGNWEEALESYRDALDIAQTPRVQIVAWEALGKSYEGRNDYGNAENAYTSALATREKLNRESLGIALGLNKVGEVIGDRGDLDRAHAAFLRALKISAQLAPQSPIVATSLNNLGVVAWSRGSLDRARDYFLQSLSIREQLAPQSVSASISLNNLGAVAWARGDLENAHNYFLRALHIREQLAPRGLEVASSLSNLGAVAQDRGDMDLAYRYSLQALEIRKQLAPQSLDVASSLDKLGVAARFRGELDHALDYHLQALQIHERFAPKSLDLATSLNYLGVVSWARGDLDRAHDYHLKALQIRQEIAPQSLAVAYSLGNLGTVAQDRGELDLAYDYYLQALQIREKLAPGSLEMATYLNNLGTVAWARGEFGRAHDYHSRALRIRKQLSPQSLDMAQSLVNLGGVALARGELDLALEYHVKALYIHEKLAPNSFAVATNLNYLGDVRSARRELDLACDYYIRAVEVLEHQITRLGGSYNVQAGFRSQHAGYYHDMLDLLLTQNRFSEALRGLERFRAQTLLTMLAERDTVFAADISEELDHERRRIAAQYDNTLKELAGLDPRENGEKIEITRRELRRLDDEAGDVEARIRQASPRLAALKYPHPLGTAEAQQALDPGTLLLSYSVGKEKTALFLLSSWGDLAVKVLPLGEEALRAQVKRMLSLIREAVQGSALGALRQQRLQNASRELYAALLAPVADRIAASERLLILPDGPLHALPFAALVRDTGADGAAGGVQYLAEWKPIHIALSATVFAELKQRRHPAGASQAPIQIAAFGDPLYPQNLNGVASTSAGAIAPVDAPRGDPIVRSAAERGVFEWPPLPYTRREVESIARLFPEGTSRTFLGPDALEERIKSLDPKTHILHLAAHGYTDEHLPSSSFVALTIPEETLSDAAGPERDNGLLQVWEIFERVRIDADLVVLSACDTGLGEEQGGEGLIGLTRAFQYAGARSVMASLWSVQDRATSELMIRFYRHLRAGLSKDEALRQAQIELIRGPIEVVDEKGEKTLLDASAPYFWAGFQVYGDWQ